MLFKVQEQIASLLDDELAFAITDPRSSSFGALEEELACLNSPRQKRLNEFHAGRRAARLALKELAKCANQPILVKPNRAPAWPSDIVGSISHCDDVCIALVGRAARFEAIGVDIERTDCFDAELAAVIATPEEIGAFLATNSPLNEALATIFSIKEAVFKALCAQTEEILEFGDLVVNPTKDGECSAVLKAQLQHWPLGTEVDVKVKSFAGHVVAVVAIEASSALH